MLRLISLLTASLLLASCLRYYPAREELVGEEGETAEYGGKEAFFSIDRRQQERLTALVKKRSEEKAAQLDSAYSIGVEDVIELSVFDVEELNRKVRVRPDGTIALPLLGTVQAAGLTEDELQKKVEKCLDKYVYNPQVHLFISEYAAHKVWVVGEVNEPGAYPLRRDDYSLLELISEAGGRTEYASASLILIPEHGSESPAKITARASAPRVWLPTIQDHGIEIFFDDLTGSVDKPPLDVPLRPGDTIVMLKSELVQVDGEVNEPGSYLLSNRMTVMGGIAAAKGLTYSADIHQVEVIRELGAGKKALITIDLEKLALKDGEDIRLRNGDVIRVPSATGRFITRQTINVFNGMFGRLVTPF